MDFIRKFDIELDKEIYYAGEILSGRIIVQNTENIRVQGIRLHLRGKAHAEWRITRAGERRTIKQDEHYIDERKSVWGKDKNEEGPIPILPRGNHKYPFEFKLPESALPCSFESKIGTIRYYIRVTIDIPYASCPQGIKYFTIVGPHIDCMDERFLSPTHAETKRYNCSLCCGKGPLSMQGTLERTAYCCGENVKLKVDIQNGCDEEVWVMVRMMQYVEYFINRGVLGLSKELRHTVIQMESPRIQPHTSTTLDELHHQLQVPIMPPTMVDVCGLVQIYYSLRICLRMENSGDALEAEMPVTIATVPFRIPTNPAPEVQHDVAADYVEGGMYISSEFQLGQVYMGDEEDEDADKEILYRPVYVCVPHIRPTPRHKMKAAAENRRSVSPSPADRLLSPSSAESGYPSAQDEDEEEKEDTENEGVRLQIIRDDSSPKDVLLDPLPVRRLRDDIPEEGIKLPILMCRDPPLVTLTDEPTTVGFKPKQSPVRDKAAATITTETMSKNIEDVSKKFENVSMKTDNISRKTEGVSKKIENVVMKTEDVSKKTENVTKKIEDVSKATENILTKTENILTKTENVAKKTEDEAKKTVDVAKKTVSKTVEDVSKKVENISKSSEVVAIRNVSKKVDDASKNIEIFANTPKVASMKTENVPKKPEGVTVSSDVDTGVTIIQPTTFAKAECNDVKDTPRTVEPPDEGSGARPKTTTAKVSTTFKQVHETASTVVVKTVETVKVKDVVVSQNESEDRQFQVSKSEQSEKEVTTERSQVTPTEVKVNEPV